MEHDPRYRFLYQIRPGVTSYATLYNGYTDSLDKMLRRLRYDLFYLEHRSWGFDTKILFMTFMNIVFGVFFAVVILLIIIVVLANYRKQIRRRRRKKGKRRNAKSGNVKRKKKRRR